MNIETKIDFLLNESFNIKKIFKEIKSMTYDKMKKVLYNGFIELIDLVKKEGKEKEFLTLINKNLKSNYKSLDQLKRTPLKESVLNEDLKHFWDFFKGELFMSATIFMGLQIWFQLDRLLDGVSINDLNFKKIVVYGVVYIFLLTGKHISMFKTWKKEHPEEWEKEGKPNIFSLRRS